MTKENTEENVRGERPGDYCKRLEISVMTFWRRLKNKRCPDKEECVDRGPSGRVLAVYPSREFDRFMKEGL